MPASPDLLKPNPAFGFKYYFNESFAHTKHLQPEYTRLPHAVLQAYSFVLHTGKHLSTSGLVEEIALNITAPDNCYIWTVLKDIPDRDTEKLQIEGIFKGVCETMLPILPIAGLVLGVLEFNKLKKDSQLKPLTFEVVSRFAAPGITIFES